MRLGFLGLTTVKSRGPPKEISWKVTRDVMQLAIELGHQGRRNFPQVASVLMLLNVQCNQIHGMFARAYWKETGRATGEVALSTHTYAYKRVKINQHTSPASTIPRNMLPLLSLRVESIWFAIDLEEAWLVLRECIPR